MVAFSWTMNNISYKLESLQDAICQMIFVVENGSQASMFQRSLSDANGKVNDIVRTYLTNEEEAMQERIR